MLTIREMEIKNDLFKAKKKLNFQTYQGNDQLIN